MRKLISVTFSMGLRGLWCWQLVDGWRSLKMFPENRSLILTLSLLLFGLISFIPAMIWTILLFLCSIVVRCGWDCMMPSWALFQTPKMRTKSESLWSPSMKRRGEYRMLFLEATVSLMIHSFCVVPLLWIYVSINCTAFINGTPGFTPNYTSNFPQVLVLQCTVQYWHISENGSEK